MKARKLFTFFRPKGVSRNTFCLFQNLTSNKEADEILELINKSVNERDALIEILRQCKDTLQYIADRKSSKSVTQLHLGEVAENRINFIKNSQPNV